MFWPGPDGNLAEDPATASGAAALVGVIIEQENLADGDHTVTVEQGVEMGRPSTITLYLSIRDGALVTLNVSGEVVLVRSYRQILVTA